MRLRRSVLAVWSHSIVRQRRSGSSGRFVKRRVLGWRGFQLKSGTARSHTRLGMRPSLATAGEVPRDTWPSNPMTVEEINSLTQPQFVEQLGWIYEHSPWV